MGNASEQKVLQCGIVGAGIAGLGATIALRRAGHEVEVFERSCFKSEIGAAITMTPNSNLILDSWNFNADKAGQTQKEQIRVAGWQDGVVTYQDSFEGVNERYGHAFNAFHGVDLHSGMSDMALNEYGVKMWLGAEIQGIDCHAGTLTMMDDSTITKDLLVVADGIKSKFVNQVTGNDETARGTGHSVFRTLIHMDKILADATISPLFLNQPSGFFESTYSSTGVLVVTYPCRSDRILNLAVFHPTNSLQHAANNNKNTSDWNTPATTQDMLAVLQGCHPLWHAIASKAETTQVYRVSHRPSITRMTLGKAVVIGDAAHAMMSTHAQGGGMGLGGAGGPPRERRRRRGRPAPAAPVPAAAAAARGDHASPEQCGV